jgi:hypothetical protein
MVIVTIMIAAAYKDKDWRDEGFNAKDVQAFMAEHGAKKAEVNLAERGVDWAVDFDETNRDPEYLLELLKKKWDERATSELADALKGDWDA